MFIKESLFKKLCAAALRDSMLRVETKLETYLISGGYWAFEINKDSVNKELKSDIIRMIGDWPAQGEAWTFSKNYGQLEFSGSEDSGVMDKINGSHWIKQTEVLIDRKGELFRAFQNKRLSFIRETFFRMIDPTEIDAEEGEDIPTGPLEAGHCILWYNNSMAIMIAETLIDRDRVVGRLENINLADELEDQE